MTFKEAVLDCFEKMFVFSARASLYEFWYWMVFYMLGISSLFILDEMVFPERVAVSFYPLTLTFLAITLIPGLAVGARRLHDAGKSAWWLCILPTVVGYAWLVYLWLLPGEQKANAWGEATSDNDEK